jgi:hypothetical protein
LDGLERSVTITQEERTRLQLHSNEMTVSMVSLCQELEDARAVTSRHPIVSHWTVDWDVATIIEALEELYPLQAEHRHLDFGSR